VSIDTAAVVSNTASVAAIEADPVLVNNSVVVDTLVDSLAPPVAVGSADLTVVISKFRTKAKNGVVSIEVQADVVNSGAAATGTPFEAQAFLSSDTVLDAGDLLLQTWSLGELGVGASSTIKARSTQAQAVGYVIVVVDSGRGVVEADENNNEAVVPIQ